MADSNLPSKKQENLYHAAVTAEWERRSETHYEPSAFATEGFVHLSSEQQLIGTLNKHYSGRSDLTLLTIRSASVAAELIWEDLYGSGTKFPHIYGPINLNAVVIAIPLSCDPDGRFDSWRPGQEGN